MEVGPPARECRGGGGIGGCGEASRTWKRQEMGSLLESPEGKKPDETKGRLLSTKIIR